MHYILLLFKYLCAMFFVLDAVRRNKVLKHTTTASIESVIKTWLRYAPDRERASRTHGEGTQGRMQGSSVTWNSSHSREFNLSSTQVRDRSPLRSRVAGHNRSRSSSTE